jgi:hypothetical protein
MEHPCLLKHTLDGIETFFVVNRNRQQNRFHWVIATLVRRRLGVKTNPKENPIEVGLVFMPERAAELFPSLCCLLNQLDECRDSSAHKSPRRKTFRQVKAALPFRR